MSDSGEATVTVPGTVPQYDTSNSCPVVAQPQIVFVVDETYAPSTRRNISYKDVFPEKAVLGLAISLILAGALSIIIKVLHTFHSNIFLTNRFYSDTFYRLYSLTGVARPWKTAIVALELK